MTNVDALRLWVRTAILIAAVCTTALPIIYSLFPWWSRPIGKLFMLQAISLALALDVNALFVIWKADIVVRLWFNAIVITIIAGASIAMGILIVWMNHPLLKNRGNDAV